VPVLLEGTWRAGTKAGRAFLTLEGGQDVRIPSVLVIPCNVGYLKQFFLVANGAPTRPGSPFAT
jgi:hypothetical protein